MNGIFRTLYNLIMSLFDFTSWTYIVEEAAVFWVTGISLVLTVFAAVLPALLCYKLIRRFFDC